MEEGLGLDQAQDEVDSRDDGLGERFPNINLVHLGLEGPWLIQPNSKLVAGAQRALSGTNAKTWPQKSRRGGWEGQAQR